VKIGATRVFNDVKLAVHAGADVIVWMACRAAPRPRQNRIHRDVGIHLGRCARRWTRSKTEHEGKVQLIVSAEYAAARTWEGIGHGRRRGLDRTGHPVRVAAITRPTCRRESITLPVATTGSSHARAFATIATRQMPGGRDDAGSGARQRLEPLVGAKRVRNYLKTLNMELTAIARLRQAKRASPRARDLVALTVEAAAMARVPLAGTDWIPGAATRLTFAAMENRDNRTALRGTRGAVEGNGKSLTLLGNVIRELRLKDN